MFRIGRIGSKKQIVSSSSRSGSASALTGPGKPRSLFHSLRPSYLRACRAAVFRHKGIGVRRLLLRKKGEIPPTFRTHNSRRNPDRALWGTSDPRYTPIRAFSETCPCRLWTDGRRARWLAVSPSKPVRICRFPERRPGGGRDPRQIGDHHGRARSDPLRT